MYYLTLYENKTHICVNLGFFSGISSCERQNFDMMKSQLLLLFYSYRRFGQKILELLSKSLTLNGNIFFELLLCDLDKKYLSGLDKGTKQKTEQKAYKQAINYSPRGRIPHNS